MAFENSVVPRDWRSTVIVSLYKEKGEVTEGLNDDEQGDFRSNLHPKENW